MHCPTRFGLVLALLLTACGADDGGTPDAGADKKLSDLTGSEKTDFCATNGKAFAAIVAGTCVLAGLDAPTTAECESARDECNGAMTSGTVCDTAGSGPVDLSACTTVRVSVTQSCIQQVQTFFGSLTCDDAGKDTPMAPACLGTIEAGCPELLGGS
jgi:hypothetical protein